MARGICHACCAPHLGITIALLLASVLFSSPFAAHGQDISSKPNVDVVVNDESSQPIPFARVWISEDDPSFPVVNIRHLPETADLRTDAAGEASQNFQSHSVDILVSADGYAPALLRAVQPANNRSIQLKLDAGTALGGMVTDSEGKPIANAAVTASSQDPIVGCFNEFHPIVTTDADGHFQFIHLAGGKYILLTKMPEEKKTVVIPTASVQIVDGQPAASVNLTGVPNSVLSGKIFAPDGVRIGAIDVALKSPLAQWLVKPDAAGRFTIDGIPAGASGIVVFPYMNGFSHRLNWPNAPSSVKSNFNYVEFDSLPHGNYQDIEDHLKKMGNARGTVTDQDGNPIAHVMVEVDTVPYATAVTTSASGTFTASIPPGQKAHLKIRRSDDIKEVETDSFTVEPGQSITKNIQTTRYPPRIYPGLIAGRVVDAAGSGVPGATVFLANGGVLPQEMLYANLVRDKKKKPSWTGGESTPAETKTSADGSFKFDKLLSGKTDIWATDSKSNWALLRDLTTDSQNIVLKLSPQSKTLSIVGNLSDENGKPVPDVRILLFEISSDWHEPDMLVETKTNSDGYFTIQATPAPRAIFFDLLAAASDGRITWRTIPFMSTGNLHLALKQPAQVRGRAVDPAGNPLEGATISFRAIDDPDLGRLASEKAFRPFLPAAQSGADGRFNLRNLPLGAQVELEIDHPDFAMGMDSFVSHLQTAQDCGDVKARLGIAIEGDVRLSTTGQPVANTRVQVEIVQHPIHGIEIFVLRSTTSDAHGHYRLAGIDAIYLRGNVQVVADSGGDTPTFKGAVEVKNSSELGQTNSDFNILPAQSTSPSQ